MKAKSGFTLIELSIVLVIVGLIIGGILVGRDLITAASIRAQIAQIEKYNTAVNTFRGKYGYLPGDIPDPYATQFGFAARGQYQGMGDGNGVLEGVNSNGPNQHFWALQGGGENAVFWEDLSYANLIDSSFSTASINSQPPTVISGANLSLYFPAAKIGRENYIYAWGGGMTAAIAYYNAPFQVTLGDGHNYFTISAVQSIDCSQQACTTNSTGLTVSEAYNMDKKLDDGNPTTGRVMATYNINYSYGSSSLTPVPCGGGIGCLAAAGGSASCFDNGNIWAAPMQYSTAQNNGVGLNCTLSFMFQ